MNDGNKNLPEKKSGKKIQNFSFIPFAISSVCYYKSLYYLHSIKDLPADKISGHHGAGLKVLIYFYGIFFIGFIISLAVSIVNKSGILIFIFCFIPLLILIILKLLPLS
jgi:hypothetical protein